MKIFKILMLLITLLFISACGNKLTFKPQEALENGSLVYVYVPVRVSSDDGSTASDYVIRINNKQYKRRIEQGEYVLLELKPNQTKISATKMEIQEIVLDLNLAPSQIYYLQITDDMSDGDFAFENVSSEKALKEISKTGLAGSNAKASQNVITEFFDSKDDNASDVKVKEEAQEQKEPLATTTSKIEELQDAAELKERGLLTDEEFNKLKAEILAK